MMKEVNECDFGYIEKNGILAFQKGPLSQWYGAYEDQDGGFVYDTIKYNCAEQWMMARKAYIFNDFDMMSDILKEKNPKNQKALGRKVVGYKQEVWDKVKKKIVFMGNVLKFSQNPSLYIFLNKTKGLTLVEAAPWDKVWGCGTGPEDERTFNEEQWQGENLLGKMIMKVRESICEVEL
jgi:ribA/ribD-fused uncharacterized protein